MLRGCCIRWASAATVCVPLGGDTGRFIREELAVSGVDHDSVESPNPTRTCVTIIDRHDGTVTELVEEHAAIPGGGAKGIAGETQSIFAEVPVADFVGNARAGRGG